MTTKWQVPPAELPPEVSELLRTRQAAQVNLYRVLASSPEMVKAWASFIWALRDDCQSPRILRELVILRVAVRQESSYEWLHHFRMSRQAGLSEEQICHVRCYKAATCYSESERIAMEVADAVCDGGISAEEAARAIGHFGPPAYVELCLTAAAYVMVARTLEMLGVPLEPGVEPQPLPWNEADG